jgi:hypothetical protein
VVGGQPPRDHACVTTTRSKAAAAARLGAVLADRKRGELLGCCGPASPGPSRGCRPASTLPRWSAGCRSGTGGRSPSTPGPEAG